LFESASGAVFSRDERYRYGLWRNWNPSLGKVLFIGLNPSTADHQQNDPTIRRCIAFAQHWDYGGMLVGNLFAYRATRPVDLRKASKPVGPDNEQWLLKMAAAAKLIIACWGNDGSYLSQDQSIQKLLPKLHCLKLNATGAPAHPLYLRKTLKPVPYNPTGMCSCT
jgi:hypothetical protein